MPMEGATASPWWWSSLDVSCGSRRVVILALRSKPGKMEFLYVGLNGYRQQTTDDGQRRHTLNLSGVQANRGFARSRLCFNEDGRTNNFVLYTVRNDTSKKGGNAPRATD